MGASSVTGVGLGACQTSKGPGNGRNFNVPEVNPHVIAAGVVTGVTSPAVIVFPAGLAAPSAIAVAVTPTTGTVSSDMVVTKCGTTSLVSMVVTATGLTGFDYTLVKAGLGLDVARSN